MRERWKERDGETEAHGVGTGTEWERGTGKEGAGVGRDWDKETHEKGSEKGKGGGEKRQ